MDKLLVEIKRDKHDVVVIANGTEVFRRAATKQTMAIANTIYFAHKYANAKQEVIIC